MKKNKIGDSFIISKISPIPENYITRDVPYLGNRYSNEDLWNLYYDERIAYVTTETGVEDGEFYNVPNKITTSLSSGGFGMIEHINALYNKTFTFEYSYISKDGYINFLFRSNSYDSYQSYIVARSKESIVNESTDYGFLAQTFNVTYNIDDFDYSYINLKSIKDNYIQFKIGSINKNKVYVVIDNFKSYKYSVWKGSNSDEVNNIVLNTPMGIVYDLEANTSRIVRASDYIAPRSINKQRPDNPDAAINNYVFDIANTEEVTVIGNPYSYKGIDAVTGEPVITIRAKVRMYQTVGLPPVVSWAYYNISYSCGFEAKKFSINYDQRSNYGSYETPFNINGNSIIQVSKSSDYYDIYYNAFDNINFSYNNDTLYDYLKKMKSPFKTRMYVSSSNLDPAWFFYKSTSWYMKSSNKYNYVLAYTPGFDKPESGSGYKTYFKEGKLIFERQGELYQRLKQYFPTLKEHSLYGFMEISEHKEIYEKIFTKYIQEGNTGRINSYPDEYFYFIGVDSNGYYNLSQKNSSKLFFYERGFATKKLSNKTSSLYANYLRVNEDLTEIIVDNQGSGASRKYYQTHNAFLLKKYLGNECNLVDKDSYGDCKILFNPYNRKDTYTMPAIFTGNDTDYRYVTKIKKTE